MLTCVCIVLSELEGQGKPANQVVPRGPGLSDGILIKEMLAVANKLFGNAEERVASSECRKIRTH